MDSQQYKLVTAIHEYLDDAQSRMHLPVSEDTIEELNAVADKLSGQPENAELSPGQEAALEASGQLLSEMKSSPEDQLSPGEAEALRASGAL